MASNYINLPLKYSTGIISLFTNTNVWYRKILEDNYGQKDKAKEAIIKKLYDDLNLKKIYEEYEEKSVGEIKQKIANIDESEVRCCYEPIS